jgi:hypothetical protein
MRNKVVIVSYLFYPSTTAGAQRVVRLANSFAKNDYDVSIICAAESALEIISTDKLENLHSNVTPICLIDPVSKFYNDSFNNKVLLFIRKIWTYLSFPDKHILWFITNRRKLRKCIINLQPDLIISTHSPFTNHFVARYLKKFSGVRTIWIADFRDAWAKNPTFLAGNEKQALGFLRSYQEKAITNNANYITSVSRRCLDTIIIDERNRATKERLLSNGYTKYYHNDDQTLGSSKYFEITFVGSLYAERNPAIFLPAFERFLDQLNANQRSKIKLRFIGTKNSDSIKVLKNFKYFNSNITLLDTIPYSDVQNYLRQSTFGLILIDDVQNADAVLTSKVFDYISVKLAIIAICSNQTAVGKLLDTADCQAIFHPHKIENITEYLRVRYKDWEGGQLNFYDLKESVLEQYENDYILKNFLHEID